MNFTLLKNKNSILIAAHVAVAELVFSLLFGPGFWGPDALNGYIQSITKQYSSTQPVFLAFICSLTNPLLPGALPIFLIVALLYFSGLALLLFIKIPNRWLASFLFFCLSFWPQLIGHIAVVQSEEMQLGLLSLFIALTIVLYSAIRYRYILFAVNTLLLLCFWLVRHDTALIAVLLSYLLSYSFFKVHSYKVVGAMILMIGFFMLTDGALDSVLHFNTKCKQEMKNALMIADLAGISLDSKVDYVPDYCWQPYVPEVERTIEKFRVTQRWERSYFSYLFNVDPTVGIFTYNTTDYTSDIFHVWWKTVFSHPYTYLKIHLKYFVYFLSETNFQASLYDGVSYSKVNNSKLEIDYSEAVTKFLRAHNDRFKYINGCIIYYNDDRKINQSEENDLMLLVDQRRSRDVKGMVHYSQIPSKIYNTRNTLTENYVLPFFNLFQDRMKIFSCIFLYFIASVVSLFFRNNIRDKYLRLAFTILICCGLINVIQRFLVFTDPIFRFGVISLLFWIFAWVILLSEYYRRKNILS